MMKVRKKTFVWYNVIFKSTFASVAENGRVKFISLTHVNTSLDHLVTQLWQKGRNEVLFKIIKSIYKVRENLGAKP